MDLCDAINKAIEDFGKDILLEGQRLFYILDDLQSFDNKAQRRVTETILSMGYGRKLYNLSGLSEAERQTKIRNYITQLEDEGLQRTVICDVFDNFALAQYWEPVYSEVRKESTPKAVVDTPQVSTSMSATDYLEYYQKKLFEAVQVGKAEIARMKQEYLYGAKSNVAKNDKIPETKPKMSVVKQTSSTPKTTSSSRVKSVPRINVLKSSKELFDMDCTVDIAMSGYYLTLDGKHYKLSDPCCTITRSNPGQIWRMSPTVRGYEYRLVHVVDKVKYPIGEIKITSRDIKFKSESGKIISIPLL